VAANTLLAATDVLRWQPAADSNGLQTAFSFAADDGVTNTNPATVQVNLTPVNDPPTFNMAGTASFNEDTGTCITLTGIGAGGGSDELAQTLTFSTQSANFQVLPYGAPFMTVTGTGSTRCLNVSPAANAHGSSVVTVTLADNGGGIGHLLSRSITITVNPVNDAPTYISGSGTFTSNGIWTWARLFPNPLVTDVDAGDTISCRFTGSLPSNV